MVTHEEQQQLDALNELCSEVQGLNQVLEDISCKVESLNNNFRGVETKLDMVCLPFQSASFEYFAEPSN